MSAVSVLEQPLVADDVAEAPALALTPLAESKLREIMAEKNLVDYGLRVYVAGSGCCSGLQYGMAFENKPQDFDSVISQNGVKLIVDASSLMYLSGARIDYVDNVMGGGFKIDNPNEFESSCSCGSGASAEDEMGSEGGCACGGSCGCNH